MTNYPNYRIAVEAIILYNGKVLLTKRSDTSAVGAGVWYVPAGKVKYEEVPIQALFRETKEETNLEVELIRQLDERTFHSRIHQEEIYRLVYTYLVKPINDDITALRLNDEHSEYIWVDKHGIQNEKYSSLHRKLHEIIMNGCYAGCRETGTSGVEPIATDS